MKDNPHLDAEQWEAYGESESVGSDPFGLLNRDNRNHAKKQDIILQTSHAEPGDRVLEVGCGDGIHARRYAELFEFDGIDISPSLVKATEDSIDSGTVRQMNALDLRYEDDTFAAVHGTAILHHLPDIETALREWLRVTQPGGSVTLMEPNYCFPKDLITTYLVPEERHKHQMKPWYVSDVLERLGQPYRHEPRIFTPPHPAALVEVYDRIDDVCRRLPVLRWAGQLQLIHVEA